MRNNKGRPRPGKAQREHLRLLLDNARLRRLLGKERGRPPEREPGPEEDAPPPYEAEAPLGSAPAGTAPGMPPGPPGPPPASIYVVEALPAIVGTFGNLAGPPPTDGQPTDTFIDSWNRLHPAAPAAAVAGVPRLGLSLAWWPFPPAGRPTIFKDESSSSSSALPPSTGHLPAMGAPGASTEVFPARLSNSQPQASIIHYGLSNAASPIPLYTPPLQHMRYEGCQIHQHFHFNSANYSSCALPW